jgi:hypothetical protein
VAHHSIHCHSILIIILSTPFSSPTLPSHPPSIYEAATCLRRLRHLLVLIDPSDRLRLCRDDYHAATTHLRRLPCMTADCDLVRDMAAITNDFFNLNFFGRLAPDVMREIFVWLVSSSLFTSLLRFAMYRAASMSHRVVCRINVLSYLYLTSYPLTLSRPRIPSHIPPPPTLHPQPIDEFTPVPSVSRDWLEISRSDEIWLTFYRHKFLRNNTVMGSMPERPLPAGLGVAVAVGVGVGVMR